MNVRFLTLARQEVDDAVVWFEGRQEGRGLDFLDALDRTVRLVEAYPYASPEIEPQIRKCLFANFPYAVIYGVDGDTIIVVAVAHTHRDPLYWVDRVK